MTETTKNTEIAVINVGALVPTQVFAPGGIDAIIASLEAEARAEAAKLDISTQKGRKEIASLAYKVARSKTALDDMGKKLVEGIKAQAATIDADRRIARDRLDSLRDEVRKRLDDFEAAEKERVNRHEAGIADISNLARIHSMDEPDTDVIAKRLGMAEAVDTSGFQEFTKRANEAKSEAITTLTSMLERSRARDDERAELERLRQEDEVRKRQAEAERIEREKKEAAERAAAQAKADAEAEAQRKADAEADRVAEEQRRRDAEAQAERDKIEAERQRAEQEKRDAEARAAQAERDRIAAEKRAKEAAEQAERDRVAAAEKAEADKQAAVLRERQKADEERRAAEAAAAKRAADLDNRRAVNRTAMEALVAAGLSEGAARTAVEAIAKGQVPGVTISY